MHKKSVLFGLCAAAVVLMITGSHTFAGEDKTTRTPAADLQWGKTPFGPMASPVFGNFAEGAHVTFVKFTSGMKTPVHTHSHDYVGVVITGATRHYVPGKPETKTLLPAGSHWFIPGNQPHVSECVEGTDCIMALYQSKNFDFKPVE